MEGKSDVARGKDGTKRRVPKKEVRGCKEECDREKSNNEKGGVWERRRSGCIYSVIHWHFTRGSFLYDNSLASTELSPSLFLPLSLFLHPSHLLSLTHALPHRGCLNRWNSCSESLESLVCWELRLIGRCLPKSQLGSVQMRQTKQTGESLLEYRSLHYHESVNAQLFGGTLEEDFLQPVEICQ